MLGGRGNVSSSRQAAAAGSLLLAPPPPPPAAAHPTQQPRSGSGVPSEPLAAQAGRSAYLCFSCG